MNTQRKLSLAAAAVLLATSGAAANAASCPGGNLVTNCGFETGDFTGWSLAGVPTGDGADLYYGVEAGADPFGGITPHGGNFQAYFSNYSADPTTLSQTLATTAGTSYTVSFYASQQSLGPTGSSGPQDTLTASFGGGSMTSTNIVDGNYVLYSFSGVASGASTTLTISMSDTYGEFIMDDISVLGPAAPPPPPPAIPEPSTLSLLGLGALMLAVRRQAAKKD